MRSGIIVGILAAVAAGFGLGYWVRDSQETKAPNRSIADADRRVDDDRGTASRRDDVRREDTPRRDLTVPDAGEPERMAQPKTGDGSEAKKPATPELDPDRPLTEAEKKAHLQALKKVGEMWSPWIKMQVTMAAPRFMAKLGIEGELADEVTAVLADDAVRLSAKAWEAALDGKELSDEEMSAMMGIPDFLSPEAEKSLAAHMSDTEIAEVREGLKEHHVYQMKQYGKMQLDMMKVPGLTKDQQTQMTDLLIDRDFMRRQNKVFMDIIRDPRRFQKAMAPGGLEKEFEPIFQPAREHAQRVLSPEQFKHYTTTGEKTIRDMTEQFLKMMGADAPK